MDVNARQDIQTNQHVHRLLFLLTITIPDSEARLRCTSPEISSGLSATDSMAQVSAIFLNRAASRRSFQERSVNRKIWNRHALTKVKPACISLVALPRDSEARDSTHNNRRNVHHFPKRFNLICTGRPTWSQHTSQSSSE